MLHWTQLCEEMVHTVNLPYWKYSVVQIDPWSSVTHVRKWISESLGGCCLSWMFLNPASVVLAADPSLDSRGQSEFIIVQHWAGYPFKASSRNFGTLSFSKMLHFTGFKMNAAQFVIYLFVLFVLGSIWCFPQVCKVSDIHEKFCLHKENKDMKYDRAKNGGSRVSFSAKSHTHSAVLHSIF